MRAQVAALANSPKTFLERDDWMRAVLASDLPHVARNVAVRIALHLRVSNGRCDPSFPTLADECRISERSTYRLVDLLEHTGWIAVTRLSGRGNQYSLVTPDNPMAGVTPDKTMSGVPLTNRARTPDKNRVDPCQQGGRRKDGTTKRTTKGKTRASHARAHPPDFLSGKGSKGSSEEGSQNQKATAIADGFARFWSAYPRKVSEDAARAAFGKVIERGADIEAVVTRAAVYAVERAEAIRTGDNPKWTLYPANWLREGKFKDPLPPGVVIDQKPAPWSRSRRSRGSAVAASRRPGPRSLRRFPTMARSNAVVRQQPQRGLTVYQSPIAQVTPALRFGTGLRPRWSEYDLSIGHSAGMVPLLIEHRGKFLPLFSRADAASEILSLAMYQQPDRPMIKAMVGALLGAFGVKADKDLLGGMVDMLEGDEIAIASGLWKPLNVSPVGLALACRKLIATSPPYPPKPPELYEACREVGKQSGIGSASRRKSGGLRSPLRRGVARVRTRRMGAAVSDAGVSAALAAHVGSARDLGRRQPGPGTRQAGTMTTKTIRSLRWCERKRPGSRFRHRSNRSR